MLVRDIPFFLNSLIFCAMKIASKSSSSKFLIKTGSPSLSVVQSFLPILSVFSEIIDDAVLRILPVDL